MGYPAPSKRETALLRALGTRQGRRKSSCCRCEGVRAVRELLEFFPENILFCVGTEKGLGQISFDPKKLRELPEHLFNDISGTVSPRGSLLWQRFPLLQVKFQETLSLLLTVSAIPGISGLSPAAAGRQVSGNCGTPQALLTPGAIKLYVPEWELSSDSLSGGLLLSMNC